MPSFPGTLPSIPFKGETLLMTTAINRQLCLILPTLWSYNPSEIICQYRRVGDEFRVDELIKIVLARVYGSLIVFSGTLLNSAQEPVLDLKEKIGKQILYSAFLPKKDNNNWSEAADDSLLFQLSPKHKVYRSTADERDSKSLRVSSSESSLTIAIDDPKIIELGPTPSSAQLVINQASSGGCFYLEMDRGTSNDTQRSHEAPVKNKELFQLDTIELWALVTYVT
jgi:hypothetical protein